MTRGQAAWKTSKSKKLRRTSSHPGVLTTKNHSTRAKTKVETNETTTDFVLCFLRNARRSNSIELGRRASSRELTTAVFFT